MGRARRWSSVALSGLVAAGLCLAAPGLGLAAAAGTEVLGWNVSGSVEAGGIYEFGENSSSKFSEYRDMDSGFVGELSLRAEKKDSPYYFDLWAINPARDDQGYAGGFGRYGLLKLDLGWDRTPHVLSTSAATIYQQNDLVFNLPPTLRNTITTPQTVTGANTVNCGGGTIISWNCLNPLWRSTNVPPTPASPVIAVGSPQYNFIQGTVNGLLRPVDLSFNTDVGRVDLSLTPTDALRFDLGYANLHRDGYRPIGTVIGSPGGTVTELAVPIDNVTNEIKFGAEFAKADYALQFSYTGSFFRNQYDSYTWDNPMSSVNLNNIPAGAPAGSTCPPLCDPQRIGTSAQGQISTAPDNFAHTFNLTGSAALPLRSRVNGTFAYTMLRQDATFLYNIPNPITTLRSNTDTAGNTSADARADLLLGNIVLTSRPFNSVTATARYRYFEYQNDSADHTFNTFPEGVGTAAVHSTFKERYTKQNAGIDIGWKPIRQLALKAGYGYEHWNRANGESFSNAENSIKVSLDTTPVDWFLGRVAYTWGDRTLSGYPSGGDPTVPATVPQFYKFNYAPRTSNRFDVLLQFTPWETFTPSLNFGFANDNYSKSQFGLTDDNNWSAGIGLNWTPVGWLTLSADYSFQQYEYTLANQSGTSAVNNWESNSKDQFNTFALNAVVDIIPKKFDVTLGYSVNLGSTKIKAKNTNSAFVPPAITATTTSTPTAYDWTDIKNTIQTFRIMGRYRLTEKLSLRGGFAYERYTEQDFARDPLQPFGGFEMVSATGPVPTAGIQSVYVGSTVPNYESYIFSAFVRYDF